MQTTKKTYEKPVLRAEQFVPNEYISACWYIACTIGIEGDNSTWTESGWSGGKRDSGGALHAKNNDGTGCGWEKNQAIHGDVSSFTMQEENTRGLGTLACDISDSRNPSELTDGCTLYWKTYKTDDHGSVTTTWSHYGTVHFEDQSRPKHS